MSCLASTGLPSLCRSRLLFVGVLVSNCALVSFLYPICLLIFSGSASEEQLRRRQEIEQRMAEVIERWWLSPVE